MAGEIKAAMDNWKAARRKLVDNIMAEISCQIATMPTLEADAKAALQLPASELSKTQEEINAIRAEFKDLTNGAPAGPLPDTSPVGVIQPIQVTAPNSTNQNFQQVLNELK